MNTKQTILRLFLESGMTQEIFCEKSGIARSTLNRWKTELDDGKPIQPAKLKAAARALGVSVKSLQSPASAPVPAHPLAGYQPADADCILVKLAERYALHLAPAIRDRLGDLDQFAILTALLRDIADGDTHKLKRTKWHLNRLQPDEERAALDEATPPRPGEHHPVPSAKPLKKKAV